MLLLTSCEEDLVIFDSVNGRSFATFQEFSPSLITFNPAADTDNVYTVSVSTVSSSDRNVSVTVDPASTLDPSFYTIQSLTPTIPAGEFSADIVVTTFASAVFPEAGSVLILNLESVQGAEVDASLGSILSYTLDFTVECPSVDIAGVVGVGATVLENELLTDGFLAPLEAGGLTREVIAGPGENQITILDGVGFNGSEDIVLDVDPVSGNVSYAGSPDAIFFFNGPDPINYTTVTGRVLTCIGLIELQIAAPFASPFDQNTFRIQFQ